jgi:RNA polymerase sigma-70 factor, ECF subfamily
MTGAGGIFSDTHPAGAFFVIDWEARLSEDGPAVWRTAQRLLGNRADADEVFQETFADAVRLSRQQAREQQAKGQQGKEPVRNWRAMLIRLATARAVDRLRQRVRQRSREVGDSNAVVESFPDRRRDLQPPDQLEQAEMSARLRMALTHLPPKQADAFCLHCLEGFSYREVAEQLGESVDHIGVLIHRARADLKERIAFILAGTTVAGAESQLRIEPSIGPSSDENDQVSHER